MMRSLRTDRARLGIALGAFALRLIAALTFARPPAGVHDPLMYHKFAIHISNGKGYANWFGDPTSYYPPGYPWFLGVQQSVLKWIGAEGSLPRVATIVQAVIGGIAAWALIGAASRLSSNPQRARRIGLAAGVIFAIWPNLVLHSSVLLSESLFLGCLCLFLLGMSQLLHRDAPMWTRSWWAHVATAGVGLGAATLTRPQVLLSLPAFALGAALVRVPWRQRLALFLAPAVLGAAVVLPWTIRNYIVFDAFVAVSTNGGDNLCIGFNRDARGHWFPPETCETGDFYLDGPEAELRRNHDATQLARTWMMDHLSKVPWLSWRKLVYTYDNDTDALRALEGYGDDEFLPDRVRSAFKVGSNSYYVAVMALAAVGLVMLTATVPAGLRRHSNAKPAADAEAEPASGLQAMSAAGARSEVGYVVAILLAGVSSAVVPILFFGEARFKVPSTPFFAMFAAVAVAAVWGRIRSERPDVGGSATADDATPEPATPAAAMPGSSTATSAS